MASYVEFPRPGISLLIFAFFHVSGRISRCRILCELIIRLGMHLGTRRHGVGRDRSGPEILAFFVAGVVFPDVLVGFGMILVEKVSQCFSCSRLLFCHA